MGTMTLMKGVVRSVTSKCGVEVSKLGGFVLPTEPAGGLQSGFRISRPQVSVSNQALESVAQGREIIEVDDFPGAGLAQGSMDFWRLTAQHGQSRHHVLEEVVGQRPMVALAGRLNLAQSDIG